MLIIFDLDGVLVDARPLHFHAFNTAVAAYGNQYVLTWDEHQKHYDGLPTRHKLELLTVHKKFPREFHDRAWQTKQAISALMVEQVFPDPAMRALLIRLGIDGHTLACASNSIRSTVEHMLTQAGLVDQFEFIIGNDDPGIAPKPSPSMFLKTMMTCGYTPEHTWIVEDSGPGLKAAQASGAHVVEVASPDDVTYANLAPHFWNVLIPMAGAGSRFADAGYTFPKPLIDIDGKPMIQVVVENLAMPGHHIFLVSKEHNATYHLEEMLGLLAPGCEVVTVDGLTEGAACTALLAEELIDNRPLLIANSDQWIRWDRDAFVNATYNSDGVIPTFESVHPKWSYAKVDEGYVVRVAEKNPISTHATCGIYWWRHGTQFVRAARNMIDCNERTNGEFYIAPVYNHMVARYATGTVNRYRTRIFPVDEMWGLGTPEDLERFLSR